MTDTNDLINQLAAKAKPVKPMLKLGQQMLLLLGMLLVYAIGAQIYLGLRPDLIHQLTDFWFEAEITTLWLLVLTSAFASVTAMAPDAYQKPIALKLPYIVFGALVLLLGYRLFTSPDLASNALDKLMQKVTETKGMACTLCIASIAMIPSAFLFAFIKRGASVHAFQAGCCAVFTAAAIGCLTLRLAEPNDSILHFVQWHYLPTLAFAIIGALIGKWFFKW